MWKWRLKEIMRLAHDCIAKRHCWAGASIDFSWILPSFCYQSDSQSSTAGKTNHGIQPHEGPSRLTFFWNPSLTFPPHSLFFSVITKPVNSGGLFVYLLSQKTFSDFLKPQGSCLFFRAHTSLIICVVHWEMNHLPSHHLLNDCNKMSLNHRI